MFAEPSSASSFTWRSTTNFLPMTRNASLILSLLAASASAFAPLSSGMTVVSRSPRTSVTNLRMALDYNDPAVAEEFATVQTMEYDDVVEELLQTGVTAPPTMTEMDVKLMLVELRMSNQRVMNKKKERPATFSSKFEEALWTKPAFEEFWNGVKATGDHNKENVVKEYLNDPEIAKTRYSRDYKKLLRNCEEALNAPPPVKSPTIAFSGFPANMGEAACKMTLEAVGTVVEFECEESEDFPILSGKVTFEDIDTAKKAVAQYDGMDMGMGQALEMTSV